MIRLGMSGFSYPEWIGEVYPKGTKRTAMLAEYAKVFNAVEINMSFRRRLEDKTVARWREAVPDTFRFAMKANAGITHYRRLVGVRDEVVGFVKVCGGLGETLGPILFQLHPTTRFDANVLNAFCADLVPGARYAIEPRHESWMSPEPHDALRRHGIALCLNDDVFDVAAHSVTASFAYFRFHREAPYEPHELEARAELVRQLRDSGVDVYAFFAHEDNPDSVRPALKFRDLVA